MPLEIRKNRTTYTFDGGEVYEVIDFHTDEPNDLDSAIVEVLLSRLGNDVDRFVGVYFPWHQKGE